MNVQNIPADHVLAYFAVAPGLASAHGIDPAYGREWGSYGVYVGVIDRRYVYHWETKHTDYDTIQVKVFGGSSPKFFHVDSACLLATTGRGVDEELASRLSSEFRAANPDLF